MEKPMKADGYTYLLKLSLLIVFFASRDAWAASAQAGSVELPNASFEKRAENAKQPNAWKTMVWSKGTKPQFTLSDEAKTGKHCVGISCDGDGADAAFWTTVPVNPFGTYRLSGWIKTENLKPVGNGRGAQLNIHEVGDARTEALTGTNDWTKVSVEFKPFGRKEVQVNCLFGGWGCATGTAWFDDIKLECIGIEKPSITIDATEKAEPMSVYIYGQFIEHMGKCIYGGIWAEMLQDRKFWYPVDDKMSPWKSIAGSRVLMDAAEPFVGKHTPVVAVDADATSGITQDGLSLIEGKKYVGYVWLKATGKVHVDIQIGSKEKIQLKQAITGLSDKYQKFPFDFTATKTNKNAVLSVLATGQDSNKAKLWVGTASVMPANNIDGMRPDTLKLLKELNSPIYRWPGGNFVSGYDWKDGIGPRDKRPPRKNPAWTGVEHNDMGIDEFMRFCEILDTEPYIAVNTGLGELKNGLNELEYVCGDKDTPMGKWRAKNGHPEPYKVTWWGIGNEMFGNWQLGHMSLKKYIEKHNEFAKAFYAKKPDAKLVAVGEVGSWSEGMMQNCANGMDLISEHIYCFQGKGSVVNHVNQMVDMIRSRADAHRDYRKRFDSLKGKDIRITMDEWNYWYGPYLFGELGTRYFQKDALGVAAGLNEFARNSDIYFMANYAQTVNVIGCIKTNKTDAAFATTGLVLKLYREHFLGTPLKTESKSCIDAQAMLSEDGKAVVLSVINPMDSACDIPLEVNGTHLTGEGKKYEIANDDPMAYNEPGVKPNVIIEEEVVSGIKDQLTVRPYSTTLFILNIQEK